MWYGDNDPTGINAGVAPPNGVFFAGLAATIAQVTDGTSNTAAFSEHVLGDFDNTIATEMGDTFWPQTYPSNADDAVAMCRAFDFRNLAYQRVSDVALPGSTATTRPRATGTPARRTPGRACILRRGS